MGLTVGLREALGRDVRIDLRAVQARVAEHLLHDAQIGSAVEQVGGRTVPQRVRAGRMPAAISRRTDSRRASITLAGRLRPLVPAVTSR